MPDVFISHATPDDDDVTRIHDALEAAGIGAWVDHQDIATGENWDHAVQTALHSHENCLYVLSKQSAKNQNCSAEWWHFINTDMKRLYIALIDDVPAADFPWRLKTEQYADLRTDFDSGIQNLAAAIKGSRMIDAYAPTTKQAKHISGSFPRWHLDLKLIGREADFAAVQNMLADGSRAAAILGLGGVGKTRLAVEIAAATDFMHGVVWHTLTKQTTAEGHLTLQIRDHLGMDGTAENDAVWAALARRQVLIVLDNAEDCIEPLAYAARINNLDTSGGTRVLITSRHHLREVRNARNHDLRAPNPDAAEAILREMAANEPPMFSLAGYEHEIAQAAHCHPRLMFYAVGWANHYPPDYVLEILRTLHGTDAEAALDDIIQKTVREVANREGGADALAALRRLAVCRGGFSFDAARALIENPAALGLLKAWNLVQGEGSRYSMDPLVLAAVGEDADAHRAHYDYYTALAWQHDDDQDYAGLDVESANLEAAFEWAMSAGAYEDAYWLSSACSYFQANRGRFEQQRVWMERAAEALKGHSDDYLLGAVQVSLGIVYRNQPIGNRRENLKRAIGCYEAALVYWTPQSAPLAYASTQNNLGIAYRNLSELEDRADNLKRAIGCYEAALEYYTPQSAPLDYATTQNNLGNAYMDLASVEARAANLKRAIGCYEAALVYRTPQSAPLAYAQTQNNLGNAYMDLASVEARAANLKRAIGCYEAALVYRTPQSAPLAYAQTQNNLGLAYMELARVEARAANLKRAIGCYEAALVYRTPQSAPLDYAQTQNNLGLAYWELASVEARAANLKRAIGCYEAALEYRTPERAPLAYAMTQGNLGLAYKDLGDLRAAITCWREAEKYYRLMQVDEWADTMLRRIAEAEGR